MVIDSVISYFLEKYPDVDYISNTQERSFPRGMDTEVFSIQALTEAFNEAITKPDREHVTPYIRYHSDRFKLEGLAYHENQGSHRWTVDTEEDLNLISKIIKALYPVKANFTLEDILNLLEKNPEWAKINAHVEQKKFGE
jgi:spore coat polysaccharide biosynthesis protein SpsF